MNCTFFNGYSRAGGCKILKVCKCDGCKFYKTEEEYNDAQRQANERLESKGLVPYVRTVGGHSIMTVRRRR